MSLARFQQDYINEKFRKLTCPIALHFFEDPVYYIDSNNFKHTFEKEEITTWLNSNKTCPVSRLPLSITKDDLRTDVEMVETSRYLLKLENNQLRQVTEEELKENLEPFMLSQFYFILRKKDKLSELEKEFFKYLTHYPIDVNSVDRSDWTPLHYAISAGNIETIQLLIEAGASASLEIKTAGGFTPLHLAIQKGQLHIVKLLLDKGASVDANYLLSAVSAQDETNQYEIIQLLLNHKSAVNINITASDKNTPLHIAASRFGCEKVVKLLLNHGANINAKNALGNTPLHLALNTKNNEKNVKILLNRGADVFTVNNKNHTALDAANKTQQMYYKKQFRASQILIEQATRAKEWERAYQQITFDEFKKEYKRVYKNAGFFGRNMFSTMKIRLAMGDIKTMSEIMDYYQENKGSRTQIVIDDLVSRKLTMKS